MTNYSLTADTLSVVAAAQATSNTSAESVIVTLTFGDVQLLRNYVANLGNLALRLQRLPQVAIVDPKTGRPTQAFTVWWQRSVEAIEGAYGRLADAVLAIQAAYDAAAQANNAAANANQVAATVQNSVDEVKTVTDALQAGTLNVPSIVVGGKKFINPDDTGLEPAPA